LAGSYHRGLLFLLHKQTFLFLALFLSWTVKRWFFVHFRYCLSRVCVFVLWLVIDNVDLFERFDFEIRVNSILFRNCPFVSLQLLGVWAFVLGLRWQLGF
jgi:hypothetical protein